MAKVSELTVDVSANLTVSDETANRCLRLLEMWKADNPDKQIVCDSRNGVVLFRIEDTRTKLERLQEALSEIEERRKKTATQPQKDGTDA